MSINKLINEKSLYLRQHSANPVDWHPWGEEAFEKAKCSDKPVFLSVGYSTCHWCHVMAHESFEDEEIAGLMNENFINIKVDREERPDIDSIYMSVCQLLTGGGGWPLTIIMTPDKLPFFAGTYIPKSSKWGRIGMIELIPRIKDIWLEKKDMILESALSIIAKLSENIKAGQPVQITNDIFDRAFKEFQGNFDSQHGGFGSAPKFPMPHNLSFLLNYHYRTKQPEALLIVTKTLKEMGNGGIRDHLGGGFHRYSTDGQWLIPHFEKMLYDQALIAIAYIEAFQVTGETEYQSIAEEILKYVEMNLLNSNAVFESAEDADSEGIEGKYYLWTRNEISNIIEHPGIFCEYYDISESGNFHENYGSQPADGLNILHIRKPLSEIAAQNSLSEEEAAFRLAIMKQKLAENRSLREKPVKDTKIMADWNALMISAFTKAGKAFERQEYIAVASKTADFILDKMIKEDKSLFHVYFGNSAAIDGFLSDYMFLAEALIELYQADFNIRYLEWAFSLADFTIKYFFDAEHGGFFQTPSFAEELLIRNKEIYDGAVPSGNSAAFRVMTVLWKISGKKEYEDAALKTLAFLNPYISRYPSGFSYLLQGLSTMIDGGSEIVISGNPEKTLTKIFISAINKSYLPGSVILHIPSGEEEPGINRLSPYTVNFPSEDNQPLVYVCKDYSCKMPAKSLEELIL